VLESFRIARFLQELSMNSLVGTFPGLHFQAQVSVNILIKTSLVGHFWARKLLKTMDCVRWEFFTSPKAKSDIVI
jgi:hypothetical protein